MIQSLYLGRVPYDEALRLQQELVELRHQGRIANVLLLLEHPPVLTLGRNASRANVLASDSLLAARGVTLHEINRGGDVTYHGPGQLVGYPIFDLRTLRNRNGGRLGPVDFVRQIEEALIGLCGEFGMSAGRIAGLTGVWCPAGGRPLDEGGAAANALRPNAPERKIGAIGIHVSRGITSHGFAFNVTTDLRDFTLIHPCGITDRPVTSLERELERGKDGEVARPAALPGLEAIAQIAARHFGIVFDEPVEPLASLDSLRATAARPAAPSAGDFQPRQFPAEDTPLRVPPELERLHSTAERPTRA